MSDTDIAIKVEKISKRYRIGLKDEMHDSLLATAIDFIKSPLKNYRTYQSLYEFDDEKDGSCLDDESKGIIWPLKNISFKVKRGEVIGIIGRNGAGKSTLLKILSRITDPTGGRVELRGRVSSLLEVGTGFHPELTGRENIYLNGTILGMRKTEIDRKYDEIVDFSEVKKFIDTPVKRYSSGMKVRLAFSVAAHLEAEILFVDEVLAVGDSSFQKKCLNKMQDIGKYGRTIIFVSHNMQALTRLCPRAILLEDGGISADGPSHKVVNQYLSASSGKIAERIWNDPKTAPCGEIARMRSIRVITEDGQVTESIDIRQPVGIEMEYEVLQGGHILLPHHYFMNEEGVQVFSVNDTDPEWSNRPRPKGIYKSTIWIPGNFLSDGMLCLNSGLITLNPMKTQFFDRSTVAFQVVETEEGAARGGYHGSMDGLIRPLMKWTTEYTHVSA
jgi:lipopolysaccharide transport system ATP-binding protein